MPLTTLRLQHRIVIPFVAVAVLTTAAAAYVAVSTLSRTLSSRVDQQSRSAAALVSQSDFALNPQILASIKRIVGVDVVTFSSDGRVIASTVDPDRKALLSAVTGADAVQAVARSTADTVELPVACDVPCRVMYHRVTDRPDTLVAVVADTSPLITATRSITRIVLLTATASVVVMIVVSQLVARRVTRPLSTLVAFTQKVGSGGDTSSRAPAGGDEVGKLGAAFNAMLDRLERSQAALVQSEKLGLAGLLAARVAHDIRNPLSSIKMQTQLLQSRTRGDTDNQAMTTAVLADIQTVEHVVRDLLELARPGDLRPKPSRIDGLVKDLLMRVDAQFRYRKIHTEIVMADDLPAVPLDVDRFGQALLNVVLNAADAMPSGGVMRVSGRRVNPSTIELEVCDDGVGIDAAILPHVFDPFVSTKRDGVGLGLVNAKAVVESHGGRIEIAARAPRGTRVTITLPVRDTVHG